MHSLEENIFYDCEQKFYKINRMKWIELQKKDNFLGIELNSKWFIDKVDKMIGFSERNKDFFCAVTKASIKNVKDFLLPMLFYEMDKEYIRVRIEHVKCAKCGWKGNIANPTLPDLYELVPARLNMMERECKIPTQNCPNCKNKLERYAIWVETNF